MKTATPPKHWIRQNAENGLLIAVIAGTVIAVSTEKMAWGLIPIAIALIFNQFNRRQDNRHQHHQLSHLETSIQTTQSEQENQQILLWQVKQKVEELEYSLQEFKQQQIQDTDSLKAKTSTLNQVESIVEKQKHLEKTNSSTQEQVKELHNYLQQITELLDSLVKFQTEQSQTMATKLRDLQLNFDPNKDIS